MLHIIRSNDMQMLAQHLAHSVNDNCIKSNNVFAKFPLIIPSLAMSEWINKKIAQHNGISAHTENLFFGHFQWRLIESNNRNEKNIQKLTLENISWQIFTYLYNEHNEILKSTSHPLHQLLINLNDANTKNNSSLKNTHLWLISENSAKVFIRYINLRPDWIQKWQNKEHLNIDNIINREKIPEWLKKHYIYIEKAQQYLWCNLFSEYYNKRQNLINNFWLKKCAENNIFSQKIYVFTVTGLNVSSLDFLQQLSNNNSVIIYQYCPTQSYINDMVDEDWIKQQQIKDIDFDKKHFDSIHSLLSKWGKQARDVARMFENIEQQLEQSNAIDIEDIFITEENTNLLKILQQEILNPNYENNAAAYFQKLKKDEKLTQDDSIKIYACHGLLRQLEVLRERIVHWLNNDKNRKLSDILVVLPDILTNKILIEAVFPINGQYDGISLPAHLTGISSQETLLLWHSLKSYLHLIEQRFTFADVSAWLLNENTYLTLGLRYEEMQRAIYLLKKAGFIRGFDEQHLKKTLSNNDKDYRFTFCYAIDRIVNELLALKETNKISDAIKIDVDLQDLEIINSLCKVAEIIATIRTMKENSKNIIDIINIIENILLTYYQHNSQSFQIIHATLKSIEERIDAIKLSNDNYQNIPIDFILHYIEKLLSEKQTASEPSGVITFGRINALRGIPYKLIVFLDANIDSFPKLIEDDRYDLIKIDKPRIGDNNKEDDESAMFLELILNAKENMWFFYNLYNEHQSSENYPCVFLQKLLNYLTLNEINKEELQKEFIVHTAQNPFQSTPQTPIIAPLWCDIACNINNKSQNNIAKFIEISNLKEFPTDNNDTIKTTIECVQFYKSLINPGNHYCKNKEIHFLSSLDKENNLEPLEQNALQRYQLQKILIDDFYNNNHGENSDLLFESPILPIGDYGKKILKYTRDTLLMRRENLFKFSKQQQLTILEKQNINLQNYIINALLPIKNHNCDWIIMYATKKSFKNIFSHWIKHLMWQMSTSAPISSICCYQDALIKFNAVDKNVAQSELNNWLNIYKYSKNNLWIFPMEESYDYFNKKSDSKNNKLHHDIENWIVGNFCKNQDKEYQNKIWNFLWRGYSKEEIFNLAINNIEKFGEQLFKNMIATIENCEKYD